MSRLRLSPFLFRLIWLAIVVAQVWIFVSAVPDGTTPIAADAPIWWLAPAGYALALQAVKALVTAARLNDLGRAPGEAVLSFVPLMNVGLWLSLGEGTPAPAERDRRLTRLAEEPTALAAFGFGLKQVAAAFPVVWTLALVGGLVHTLAYAMVDRIVPALEATTPADRLGAAQLFAGIGALLAGYALVQWTRRATASRASWLPALFAAPALAAAGGIYMIGNGPIPVVLLLTAIDLAWACVVGAYFAAAWIGVSDAVTAGREVTFGDALGPASARGADLAGPHGGAELAITIGLQVVVPGLLYMVRFAFVDQVAYREPQRPALRRSSDLSAGQRRKLFVLIVYAFFLVHLVQWPLAVALVGGAQLQSALFVQTSLGLPLSWAWDVIFLLGGAVLEIGLLHLYDARVAVLDARDATVS